MMFLFGGQGFYNSFVLTKDKLQKFVRKDESIIWIVDASKVNHKINPFIKLDDGNIFICYGAIEQAINYGIRISIIEEAIILFIHLESYKKF